MVTKYSRLATSDITNSELGKWAKSRLPVNFLRQQIFLVSLVVSSFLLYILTTFLASDLDYDLEQNLSPELSYGVIVDCGSSGTRAHLFEWRQGPTIRQIEYVRDKSGKLLNKHITPGLSSLSDNPDKASDYMEPLMHFISESIPYEKHLDTPIYFLATAGLRLLDSQTQKKILTDITRDLRAKFNFPKIKSKVISGKLEGLYSWLSLNTHKRPYSDLSGASTYGMIEMGGASTQVTFELTPSVTNAILSNLKDTDAISAFKDEQVTLNLGPDNSVKLFATTFLGLGVNSARGAAIDLMARDYLNGTDDSESRRSDLSKFGLRLKDPCLTMGSSEIVMRPDELLKNPYHPIGSTLKDSEKAIKVRLEGTGDFISCMNLLNRVLKSVKIERLNCPPSTKQACSMALLGTHFIPFSSYPFIGLSEMFFTTDEMMNSAGLFNRSKVLHETQRICSTQYNKLLEQYSHRAVSRDDRILYECFKASWLLNLLNTSGFKMPANYDNFRTVERLDEEEIDWTMGAIIAEVALGKLNSHIT